MFFKSKKLLAAGMLLSMMAFAAAGCGGGDKKAEAPKKDAAKIYNVGIVQIVQHEALDDSRKGFIEGMKKKGFVEGKNVKYDAQNAQGDQSNLQTIAQRFVNNKVDLICAISTPAAQQRKPFRLSVMLSPVLKLPSWSNPIKNLKPT